MKQITDGTQMIKQENDPHAAFALIIDGKTLAYALEDDMKYEFLNLAIECASVICCRVSPRQKALVRYIIIASKAGSCSFGLFVVLYDFWLSFFQFTLIIYGY